MPRKKQVTFQGNIPGKFIPRDDPPSASVLRAGGNSTRFNSKMAELLASSSPPRASTNENVPAQDGVKPSPNDPRLSPAAEIAPPEPARVHSRLIQRRIATMLEALRGRGSSGEPIASQRVPPSNFESKSQPITFGQLRQATNLSVPPPPPPPAPLPTVVVIDDVPSSQVDTRVDVTKRDAEQPKPPLTVDEILATYCSKLRIPTTGESHSSSSMTTSTHSPSYTHTSPAAHLHPSTLAWTPPQANPYALHPLLLNEQHRNRPPPPSYSSSVTSSHQPPSSSTNDLSQHLLRLPVSTSARESLYAGPQLVQPLPPGNAFARPPPPRYESTSTNIERSHSALSSMDRPKHSPTNPPQAGFDREFSRLLYGKEGGKSRHQRQKRKAFSDPVKKSVEEAGQTAEKTHRRLTTHLNKTDTVREEEETSSDSYELEKHEQKLLPQRHAQRQSDKPDSARKAIVPANPILSRRIPSFLVEYSQASPPNDIPRQWHHFSSLELQSYDAMMRKLYKDENLVRVKLYETYRALLTSVLASKPSSKREKDDNEDDYITTTAL